MISGQCVLAVCLLVPGQTNSDDGTISGTVVNASQGGVLSPAAEVMLRVRVDGQFIPVAETVADAQGNFEFDGLPVDERYLYLPGANRDGIHYPGPRIRLTAARHHVVTQLKVCDSISHPNLLVIRRFDVHIQTEPGALRVTESILVDNPTQTTYVGPSDGEGEEPVTLRLGIPSDFERTTFHQEFFGRRFSLADGKLVTGIPWTPGQRELKMTYTLRNDEKHRVWQRPLDLPCDVVRVQIDHDNPEEVFCSLPRTPQTGDDALDFQSAGGPLPAGHVIRVQLGQLPLSWMAYARWGALGVLVVMVSAVGVAITRQRPKPPSGSTSSRRRIAA